MLDERGFGYLDDTGVPLTNSNGDLMALLAMVLETYCRNPAGKHVFLQRLKAKVPLAGHTHAATSCH